MQDFSSWTLKKIREDTQLGWMEERRFEWLPIVSASLERLIDAQTTLIITDSDREWLGSYMIKQLNRASFDRPLLPIIKLDAIFPHIDTLNSSQKIALLNDMLALLFPNGYNFFYIGLGSDLRADIAKDRNDSLLWLLDERNSHALSLSSKDHFLDTKLVQLVRLYDESIDVALFGEVDLQGAL